MAMPISMMRPIIDGIDSADRVTNSARKAPGTDKGEAWRVTVAAAAVDQALTQGWRRVEPGQEITPMACR